MAKQKLYKKLSVLFYEKDKELIDGLEKISELREDSMSKIVKQLIAEELKRIQAKIKKGSKPPYRKAILSNSLTNLIVIPA